MTLGILAALPDEISGVVDNMALRGTQTLAGREFHNGELHGQPVVLALCRIGKVAAATTATLLIQHFGCTALVFTGVAGGLGARVRVGDVVVGSACAQHDIDASPLFARGEVPLTGITRFLAEPSLLARCESAAAAALLDLQSTCTAHAGLLLSGDQLIADPGVAQALVQHFPDALAVDMESAAVAQVCHDFHVPFVAVRRISDDANHSAAKDFLLFVQTQAAPFSQAFLKGLLSTR